MSPLDIDRYRGLFLSNPSAFVKGVHGFCKRASEDGGLWDSIKKPLLLGLLAYGGLRAGSSWGRYANSTGNPNGPIRGPLLKILEAALPKDEHLVYPGTKQYDDVVAYRTAIDDAKWDAAHGNSVRDGRARSLTMRAL